MKPYVFEPHNAPALCPRCGRKVHISDIRSEWTGVRVCTDCWDPKHPQLNVRGRADRQYVRGGALPEPTDVFIEPYTTKPSDL